MVPMVTMGLYPLLPDEVTHITVTCLQQAERAEDNTMPKHIFRGYKKPTRLKSTCEDGVRDNAREN